MNHPNPTEQPESAVPSRKPRALVIDDEPILAEVIQHALSPGVNVDVAAGGKQGLKALLEAPAYDLVLCDMRMPDLTGMEIFERIVAARPELGARFVFMTGGTLDGRSDEFLRSHGARVMRKPFPLQQLREAVSSQLVAAGGGGEPVPPAARYLEPSTTNLL